MIFNPIEQLMLSVLIISAISSFSLDLFKKYKIIMKGTGDFPLDNLPSRIKKVFFEFILQKKVLSQRFWPGLMHALVFWGFIFFSIITIDHFLLGYNIHFFSYNFKMLYAKFFGLPWAIFVLIGILSLAYRRFITRPIYLGEKLSYTSGLVVLFISLLMVTYIIDVLSTNHQTVFMKANWWLHAI